MGRDVSQRNVGPVPTADCCGTNRPAFESQVLEPHCTTLSAHVTYLFCVSPKFYILYNFFLGGGAEVCFESTSEIEYTNSNDMLISLRDVLMEAQRVSTRTDVLMINPLNTKRRLLYLKPHFVPRSKHFSSRL